MTRETRTLTYLHTSYLLGIFTFYFNIIITIHSQIVVETSVHTPLWQLWPCCWSHYSPSTQRKFQQPSIPNHRHWQGLRSTPWLSFHPSWCSHMLLHQQYDPLHHIWCSLCHSSQCPQPLRHTLHINRSSHNNTSKSQSQRSSTCSLRDHAQCPCLCFWSQNRWSLQCWSRSCTHHHCSTRDGPPTATHWYSHGNWQFYRIRHPYCKRSHETLKSLRRALSLDQGSNCTEPIQLVLGKRTTQQSWLFYKAPPAVPSQAYAIWISSTPPV